MVQRVVAVDNLITHPLGDELFILNLNNEKYYTLNDIGLRMWQILTTGHTVDEAILILASEYDATEDQLRHDIEKFVQHLCELVLVEIHDE